MLESCSTTSDSKELSQRHRGRDEPLSDRVVVRRTSNVGRINEKCRSLGPAFVVIIFYEQSCRLLPLRLADDVLFEIVRFIGRIKILVIQANIWFEVQVGVLFDHLG